ncbi:MAG: UPF0721 transmembrane protein [Phycisphaerae bacterium]|nr:MAG: UPF0721 transmembrane protein [Phycisphaerae bacterium]
MLYALSVLFGGMVGFALGVTGGGGSLLAVPLLVYGLSIAPREAFGISLAAVGATALVGVVPRIVAGQAEVGTGLIFAAAGMVGAPVGTWLAGMISEPVLLTLFAALMLLIAQNMWRSATNETSVSQHDTKPTPPTCERTAAGAIKLTSRCTLLLIALGLLTGILSGMFGVGGGFVIVPALVMFSGMPIHNAIATSLLVIVLVSISGVASHFVAGRGISLSITGMFIAGGIIGMTAGGRVAQRMSAARLQRVFSAGIVAVALFVIGKTIT